MKVFIIKTITILIFILTFSTLAFASNQTAFRWGYHWWESGQTFVTSEKSDRAFDGQCWELEYAHWWNKLGLTFNGGKNLHVNEVMFSPNWRFKAKLITAEFIPQFKIYSSKSKGIPFDVRLGFGINYSKLRNSYGVKDGETLRDFGWLGLIGID